MRFQKMLYTIKHKKAFLKVEKDLLGHNTTRGYLHDIEKPLFYLLFGIKRTSKLHNIIARHHNPKIRDDLIESIIDFECARYTKPDKPLNARDYIYKHKQNMIKLYEPLLKELGL